jgi:hypothetical protein
VSDRNVNYLTALIRRASYSSASASSALAPSPAKHEPCITARLAGARPARFRIVGPVRGVRHVAPKTSSACEADSTMSSLVMGRVAELGE